MFKGASGFHAGESGGAPPVGTGGIYGGDGSVPNGTIATIGDTLTFAGGSIDVQANKLLFGSTNDYIQSGVGGAGNLKIANTGNFELICDTDISFTETANGSSLHITMSEFYFNGGTGGGGFNVICNLAIPKVQFQEDGVAFLGNLTIPSGLVANRTWTLPDASGTIALTGSTGLYGGSGNVPTSVVATLADTLEFNSGRVGIGGPPDASAILQADSTTQGFLPPRMTTLERAGIVTPATGLIVYNTTTNQWEGNSGTPGTPVWVILG